MAVVEREPRPAAKGVAEAYPHAVNVGPIGRLGRYTATHFRVVLAAWLVVAVGLGFFAPRVETALSGAGWETSGSQSVQARQLINKNFAGLSSYALMTVLYSPTKTINDPAYQAVVANVERTLKADSAVKSVIAPAPGRLDLPRRAHRDRPGGRRAQLQRDGQGCREHQGQARRPVRQRRAGASDRRVRDVV